MIVLSQPALERMGPAAADELLHLLTAPEDVSGPPPRRRKVARRRRISPSKPSTLRTSADVPTPAEAAAISDICRRNNIGPPD